MNKAAGLVLLTYLVAVTLAWDHPGGAEGFRLYRADGQGFQLVATVAGTVRTWTDQDAKQGQYSYFVTAFSGAAESGPSNVVTISLPPPAPDGVAATASQ